MTCPIKTLAQFAYHRACKIQTFDPLASSWAAAIQPFFQSLPMQTSKTIAVGSLNPVKIQAAQVGFERMFPDTQFSTSGFSVASGVGDQPMSCAETLDGARNRAKALKELAPEANYCVGIEGGIEIIEETLFANAWIVIRDADGKVASGRSGSFALPPKVKLLVESGIELGHANDQVFDEHNSKQQGGAVGSLTGGVITRLTLYEHAMALALIAFKQPTLYR